MKLLMHMCCGPCSIYPLASLREQGHEVMGLFYNPNIHPYQEFSRRLETLKDWADQENLKVIVDEDYQLEEFLRQVAYREGHRCQVCYATRLKKAAQFAKAGHFDGFTTSLLVSPFQKHELIKQIGESIAEENGIPFYYEDFRTGFKQGVETSKAREMYRQQYCGCIFSERDRYRPNKKVTGKK